MASCHHLQAYWPAQEHIPTNNSKYQCIHSSLQLTESYHFGNKRRNFAESLHLFSGSKRVYEKNISSGIRERPRPNKRFIQRHSLASIRTRHNHNIATALPSRIHGRLNLHHCLFSRDHPPPASVSTRFRRYLTNTITNSIISINGVHDRRNLTNQLDVRNVRQRLISRNTGSIDET